MARPGRRRIHGPASMILKIWGDARLAADRADEGTDNRPSYWMGKEVFTSVSIGIALSNSAYENPDDMLPGWQIRPCIGPSPWASPVTRCFDAGHASQLGAAFYRSRTDLRHALGPGGNFRNYYQPDRCP